ncbi:MAG: autotransporter-associated beta strand repeat-containing protein [Verrucomicrobia bacterium]|nr:autotransporter-associated beta strand repeat-containing protein [Verrucomicrobiota bacterium]
METRIRNSIYRLGLAALAAGCWSLAAGSLGATQVLTLPVASSSTMGVKLSVDPGSGLGTASDTETPNLQGTVLVQLDDNGAPTQIALRDFTLQPQNNNPLDFNLAWSKPIIGVVERVHATASNLLFYHNNPGSPNPYYPVTSGAFTVTNVPYKTTGAVHYTESGLQSGSGDLNVNVTGMIGEMAGTVTASGGVVTVHLTFSTVADISSGGLNANLTFNGNVTASGTTGDFTWDGTVAGNWSDLHWNPGLVAGPTTGTATATINSGSVSLTSGVDYTGTTTITGGSLAITGSGQLNAGAAWSGRLVNVAGGTLEIDKWNGAGSLGTASYEAGNLILNGGTLRYTGSEVMTPVFTDGGNGRAFTIGSNGGTLESAAGSGHVFAITQYSVDPGVYALADLGGTLTLAGSGNGYLSKVLKGGSGSVIKNGTGTWTLAAVNSYAGGTIVNNGMLILNSASSDVAVRGTVTVNSGGTLGIAGADWAGLGQNAGAKIDTLNLVGGTVTNTLNTAFITDATVNMTGGTLSGGQIHWRNTVLSTLAGTNTATISSNVMIRNDYAPGVSMTLNVANGDAATDLLISGGISQAVSGAGITKTGAGTLVLAGSNTYTGNTTVYAGSLILAAGGSLNFHPTANHVSNRITGTGSPAVTLNGTLYLDLAGADLTIGNTWTLVDVANVAASFGGTVTSSLGAFSNNADIWQLVKDGKTWTFNEATGQLALETDPFASWINATWPLLTDQTPAGDPDHDGISNLLEYVLQNGDPSLSSTGILPTASASGTNFVFTFHRRHASTADTSQTFQYGSDLSGWTEVALTHVGMVSITPNTPAAGIDEVIVTVPKNGSPALFGRLKVSK